VNRIAILDAAEHVFGEHGIATARYDRSHPMGFSPAPSICSSTATASPRGDAHPPWPWLIAALPRRKVTPP
jgi:hypothetical protein